jgi:hypothetical protein
VLQPVNESNAPTSDNIATQRPNVLIITIQFAATGRHAGRGSRHSFSFVLFSHINDRVLTDSN